MSALTTDFYAWTLEQADLLRRKAWSELDVQSLADEIESIGYRERRELVSRLEVLLVHLLKWKYQPELRCGSWRASIDETRSRIEDILADSPSLRPYPEEYLARTYARAAIRTARETGLVAVPNVCPWTVEQILDKEWLPE
jgi:hypothetical protein